MPANPPGPWTLDKVKKRLRAEQVQREKSASERYRRPEQKELREKGKTRETSACQGCLLVVLTLCCILLSIVVLVLSSVVLRTVTKG